jgi:hypothetical protein
MSTCCDCVNLYGHDRYWACFKHHTLLSDLSIPEDCKDDFESTVSSLWYHKPGGSI